MIIILGLHQRENKCKYLSVVGIYAETGKQKKNSD